MENNGKYQAVIMAGGKGTRLASVTMGEFPKPMVPVTGKPLLEWQIEKLKENGITDIYFIIGHLGKKIQEYFGDGTRFGFHARYIEEKEPLGTAGVFYYLKDMIVGDSFYLIFGDVLFDIDLPRMEAFHRQHNARATLFVHPNSHPYDSDLVELDNDGRVVRLESKDHERSIYYRNLVNAGLYLLDAAVCEMVGRPAKMDLENEVIVPMIEQGLPVFGYLSPEYIKDVGTPERIAAAEEDMNSGVIAAKSLKKKQKCVFVTLDCIWRRHKAFIHKRENIELNSYAVDALKVLNKSAWLVIVITKRTVTEKEMCGIIEVEDNYKMLETLLGEKGVYVNDIMFEVTRQCEEKYNIDFFQSWIAGDTITDIQTGKKEGLRTVLLKTGEAGSDDKFNVKADFFADNLLSAAEYIMRTEERQDHD